MFGPVLKYKKVFALCFVLVFLGFFSSCDSKVEQKSSWKSNIENLTTSTEQLSEESFRKNHIALNLPKGSINNIRRTIEKFDANTKDIDDLNYIYPPDDGYPFVTFEFSTEYTTANSELSFLTSQGYVRPLLMDATVLRTAYNLDGKTYAYCPWKDKTYSFNEGTTPDEDNSSCDFPWGEGPCIYFYNGTKWVEWTGYSALPFIGGPTLRSSSKADDMTSGFIMFLRGEGVKSLNGVYQVDEQYFENNSQSANFDNNGKDALAARKWMFCLIYQENIWLPNYNSNYQMNQITDNPTNVVINTRVSGIMESLLDYKKVKAGEKITLGDNCFSNLFCNNPMYGRPTFYENVEMGEGAYRSMFRNTVANFDCSLKNIILPAKKIAKDCYKSMFENSSCFSMPYIAAQDISQDPYFATDIIKNSTFDIVVNPSAAESSFIPGCDLLSVDTQRNLNFVKGNEYYFSRPNSQPNGSNGVGYITFSSNGKFSLSIQPLQSDKYYYSTTASQPYSTYGPRGNLFYSYDKVNWRVWHYWQTIGENETDFNNKIYVCGEGNYKLCSNIKISSSTSSPVECSGELIYLNFFDHWKNGKKVNDYLSNREKELGYGVLSDECYKELFKDNVLLVSIPSLQSVEIKKNIFESMFENTGIKSLSDSFSSPSWNSTIREGAFKNMFKNCKSLDLKDAYVTWFPYTNTAKSCFEGMFEGCSSITNINLILQIENLEESSFKNMFKNCTSLRGDNGFKFLNYTKNIGKEALCSMFEGCASLKTIPVDFSSVSVFGEDACSNMFKSAYCGKLDSVIVPQGASVAKTALSNMFDSSLITQISTNALRAKTIGEGSYRAMFRNCKNLTNISADFISSCENTGKAGFYSMFEGCENLRNVSALISPSTLKTSSQSFAYMFKDCKSLVSVSDNFLPYASLSDNCYEGMFEGCSSFETPVELPCYDTIPRYAYRHMFKGTNLKTAPNLPSAKISTRSYEGMFQDCKNLTASPKLGCVHISGHRSLAEMFSGCENLEKLPSLKNIRFIIDNEKYGNSRPSPTTQFSEAFLDMFNGCKKIIVSSTENPQYNVYDGFIYQDDTSRSSLTYSHMKGIFNNTNDLSDTTEMSYAQKNGVHFEVKNVWVGNEIVYFDNPESIDIIRNGEVIDTDTKLYLDLYDTVDFSAVVNPVNMPVEWFVEDEDILSIDENGHLTTTDSGDSEIIVKSVWYNDDSHYYDTPLGAQTRIKVNVSTKPVDIKILNKSECHVFYNSSKTVDFVVPVGGIVDINSEVYPVKAAQDVEYIAIEGSDNIEIDGNKIKGIKTGFSKVKVYSCANDSVYCEFTLFVDSPSYIADIMQEGAEKPIPVVVKSALVLPCTHESVISLSLSSDYYYNYPDDFRLESIDNCDVVEFDKSSSKIKVISSSGSALLRFHSEQMSLYKDIILNTIPVTLTVTRNFNEIKDGHTLLLSTAQSEYIQFSIKPKDLAKQKINVSIKENPQNQLESVEALCSDGKILIKTGLSDGAGAFSITVPGTDIKKDISTYIVHLTQSAQNLSTNETINFPETSTYEINVKENNELSLSVELNCSNNAILASLSQDFQYYAVDVDTGEIIVDDKLSVFKMTSGNTLKITKNSGSTILRAKSKDGLSRDIKINAIPNPPTAINILSQTRRIEDTLAPVAGDYLIVPLKSRETGGVELLSQVYPADSSQEVVYQIESNNFAFSDSANVIELTEDNKILPKKSGYAAVKIKSAHTDSVYKTVYIVCTDLSFALLDDNLVEYPVLPNENGEYITHLPVGIGDFYIKPVVLPLLPSLQEYTLIRTTDSDGIIESGDAYPKRLSLTKSNAQKSWTVKDFTGTLRIWTVKTVGITLDVGPLNSGKLMTAINTRNELNVSIYPFSQEEFSYLSIYENRLKLSIKATDSSYPMDGFVSAEYDKFKLYITALKACRCPVEVFMTDYPSFKKDFEIRGAEFNIYRYQGGDYLDVLIEDEMTLDANNFAKFYIQIKPTDVFSQNFVIETPPSNKVFKIVSENEIQVLRETGSDTLTFTSQDGFKKTIRINATVSTQAIVIVTNDLYNEHIIVPKGGIVKLDHDIRPVTFYKNKDVNLTITADPGTSSSFVTGYKDSDGKWVLTGREAGIGEIELHNEYYDNYGYYKVACVDTGVYLDGKKYSGEDLPYNHIYKFDVKVEPALFEPDDLEISSSPLLSIFEEDGKTYIKTLSDDTSDSNIAEMSIKSNKVPDIRYKNINLRKPKLVIKKTDLDGTTENIRNAILYSPITYLKDPTQSTTIKGELTLQAYIEPTEYTNQDIQIDTSLSNDVYTYDGNTLKFTKTGYGKLTISSVLASDSVEIDVKTLPHFKSFSKDEEDMISNALCFYSESPFSISAKSKGWNGSLYKRDLTSHMMDSLWDNASDKLKSFNLGEYHYVIIYGKNNTKIDSNLVIESSANVYCIGNISKLLDKDYNVNKRPSDGAFKALFKDCGSLVSSPKLDLNNLSVSCYESLFENSGLLVAPTYSDSIESVDHYTFKRMYLNCAAERNSELSMYYALPSYFFDRDLDINKCGPLTVFVTNNDTSDCIEYAFGTYDKLISYHLLGKITPRYTGPGRKAK